MPQDAGGWFDEWAGLHCRAVGAGADAVALFGAERLTFLGPWAVTPAELGEVTARLSRRPTPPTARDVVDAAGRELVAVRAAGSPATLPMPQPAGGFAPDCPACGGSGVATVPHRRCVWQRRIVLHPEVRMLVTAGVLCDRPGCEAGRAARDKESARKDDKPRRPTLSQAERFHGCDLVELLRAHEREQARLSRRDDAAGGEWAALVASIKARASAAGGHPREDAA